MLATRLSARWMGDLVLCGMISTRPVLDMSTQARSSWVLLARVSTRLLMENMCMAMAPDRVPSTKLARMVENT